MTLCRIQREIKSLIAQTSICMLAFTDFSLLFFFSSSLLFLFFPFPLTFSVIPHLSQLTGYSSGGCNFINADTPSAWPEETHLYTRPSVYGVNRTFRGISEWRLMLKASTLSYIWEPWLCVGCGFVQLHHTGRPRKPQGIGDLPGSSWPGKDR